MKRGWITRDRTELPQPVFDARLDIARKALAERDLPALVVYTDVWRSNQGRYFSNFMPYWNRALLVIPRDGAPVLLCGLSPRVYPWIRSVTILDEIRPSANIADQLLRMCGEKDWTRIGVLDLPQLPFDLTVPNAVDIPWSAVHPAPDEAELSMYRHAAKMAREILADELPNGVGLVDHAFAGRLERRFRRAGAEDLAVLVTNGRTPPLPPNGSVLGDAYSVLVAVEYRGHWVKVCRPLVPHKESARERRVELLSGSYPYRVCDAASLTPGSLFAVYQESNVNGHRSFYGDTYRKPDGAELL